MTTAIVGYPLSLDFRRRLEDELGEVPLYLHLPELRRRSPLDLVRTLAALGPTCIVPLEDEASYPLLPILESIAALSAARRIEIVHTDLRREPVSRRRAFSSLGALVAASANGQLSLRRSHAELRRLLAAPRTELTGGDTNRIVYANANLWFGVRAGGSVGHIAGVLGGLVGAGFRVEYAAPTPPVTAREDVVFRAVEPPHSFGLPVETNYYRFQQRMAAALSDVLREPARFLYQRMSVGNYAGVVASRRTRVPLVLEYNGSEVWAAEHWGNGLRYADLALAAENACLRHAALIVTVSEVLRDELVERGVSEERIVWYPNGVDASVFDPAAFGEKRIARLRSSLGISGDAVVVTFVGTFGQWHGADVLARAIAKLVDEHVDLLRATPVRFLLVGDGDRMSFVRELLDREPYREFVNLTGLVPQAEAPLHLAASDILVSPHVANEDGSRFFGSPTKLFEYMAMGKPIVASALDQIGAVLQPALDASSLSEDDPDGDDDRVAVLARPGSVEDIVAGLRFLIERPPWRDSLGRNARAKAISRYTWTHHVQAILDGVERLGG